MSDQRLKFCVDCRHYRVDEDYTFWNPTWRHRCWHPQLLLSGEFDLVTGEQDKPIGRVAYDIRKNGFACGPKGKLFEPKEESITDQN